MDSGPFAIVTSSPPDPVCPSRAILDNRRRVVLLNRADCLCPALPGRLGILIQFAASPTRTLAYDFQGAMTVHSLSLTAGSTRGA